jgi:hypothetical protein
LAEFSKEGLGSRKDFLPTVMMSMMIIVIVGRLGGEEKWY